MRISTLSVVVTVLLQSAITAKAADTIQPYQALPRLADMMTGSFSSAEQAAADTAFLDIRVQMMPIWKHLSSAIYIYIEQARADQLDLPYRQRVYRLTQLDDTTLTSQVFELKDRVKAIGAWRKFADSKVNTGLQYLNSLTPDDLQAREGCTIYLHPEGDSAFVGSTRAQECTSNLRGASYATSEVRIAMDYMYSWDRGFDSTGTQVWGATKGGYWFKKVRE
ncbi:MAG: chromophore lyase CpcT/CpeT [bacterium]|nr:chromophore lyase CpcT/CpeT [bacterium]